LNYSKLSKIILIGASTGGPGLIEQIVTAFYKSVPIEGIIIIAQHMQPFYLQSFAKRLQRVTDINVCFVTQTTKIKQNTIYILEDSSFLTSKTDGIYLEKELQKQTYYHPSIDELFSSATQLSLDINAYLLSGIGDDGALGLLALKKKNHRTIAQDEQTSIVYGMPRAAFEKGAVNEVLSINDIIKKIQKELQ